ncbi:two-component system response regulator CreB [Methylomonas methanica]|uniref:Two component transcriptional regulator, winged helix family n=1 Tax=Methylomonas methanica (strain DSM 25384 / MC09) TaxID=857087 RepID=F9ZXQ7_METMM|nr:two-component system response regulator CreB [Methylomonas methanica]AEG02212.1 two component transcriptional regulator, winged helix family [Methylomonas methanica MC09]
MTDTRTVLIIEDEAAIAETICYALSTDGFQPHWRATGREGIACAEALRPPLVLLDIGLPDSNGFEVFRSLQSRFETPPAVIFLTARSEEVDRVVGLELGADDYIGKPFSPRELCARVRAVLRRSQPPATPPAATAGDSRFQVNPERFEVRYHGTCLSLTLHEFRLLHTLIQQPQRVFNREELLTRCWDAPEHRLDRAIDTHIKALRAKLNAVRPGEDAIKTHRGIGYSLQ